MSYVFRSTSGIIGFSGNDTHLKSNELFQIITDIQSIDKSKLS